jgi:hypothetical protein
MLTSEVVILGGGNPITGLNRYKSLGAMYNGDWSFFQKMLLERKRKGLLSVGFSAGVDHLCEFLSSCINYEMPVPRGFGICHNIIAFSHFENGREGLLRGAAKDFGNCFIFGLPNDSGIAVYEGFLGSGNIWQAIQFIIDNTWDNPSDQFHIKTRQGVKIQHFYTDGRHWAFSGGDTLVRIQSGDGAYNVSFIAPKQGHILDYWSQTRTDYSNIKEILANH